MLFIKKTFRESDAGSAPDCSGNSDNAGSRIRKMANKLKSIPHVVKATYGMLFLWYFQHEARQRCFSEGISELSVFNKSIRRISE
jgi:hypothetical protein